MIAATMYLRTLGLYCELNNTSPRAILKDARSKEFRDGFLDLSSKAVSSKSLMGYAW